MDSASAQPAALVVLDRFAEWSASCESSGSGRSGPVWSPPFLVRQLLAERDDQRLHEPRMLGARGHFETRGADGLGDDRTHRGDLRSRQRARRTSGAGCCVIEPLDLQLAGERDGVHFARGHAFEQRVHGGIVGGVAIHVRRDGGDVRQRDRAGSA